jgi:1-acyl-sn-glycerol-3-phosphate acyltransferase
VWAGIVLLAGTLIGLLYWRHSLLNLHHHAFHCVFIAYARLWHRCTFTGIGHIPQAGPVLLVANHTCSADAAFLIAACPRPLGFLTAFEYYLPVLRLILHYLHCVPVRRDGQDVVSVREALRRLSEGRALCIFPEGGLSNAGRIRPQRGKAGAAYIALRSLVPVCPVWIEGGPQTDEVLDAWVGGSRKPTRVIIGRPIDLSAYYNRPIRRPLVEEVMNLLSRSIENLGTAPLVGHASNREQKMLASLARPANAATLACWRQTTTSKGNRP